MQIIRNRERYKTSKNNLSLPLSYEFDDTKKEIDNNITEEMSERKNLDEFEDKLKNKLKMKIHQKIFFYLLNNEKCLKFIFSLYNRKKSYSDIIIIFL